MNIIIHIIEQLKCIYNKIIHILILKEVNDEDPKF